MKCLIKPILKSKASDPRVRLNYRGISHLPTISKLFSCVLNTRLTKYLEFNDFIVDEQNGFRKLRSCADHLFTLCSSVRNCKEKGQPTFACFIDMQKAFDRVERDCLLSKLLAVGVNGRFYTIIKSLYGMSKARVNVNGKFTDFFNINCGVEQGNKISPTLFSLYVNDLAMEHNILNLGIPLDNEKICILMYADDIVILAGSEDDLQQLLDTVNRWCPEWRMQINSSKTNIIHFRKMSQNKTNVTFYIGEHDIGVISQYKYLGCVLTEHLDFSETTKVLAKSARRALGALINKARNVNGSTFNVYSKLYETSVMPAYCEL